MEIPSCTRPLVLGMSPLQVFISPAYYRGRHVEGHWKLTNFLHSIKITCAPNNNVLEGTLFTTCNVTNAIAINTAPAPPNPTAPLSSQPGDYHIIPFAHIISFELIGPGERAPESGPGFDGALPSISKVDLDALKAREEQTIREMKKKDAQKGKGVTKEAQEIFDTIARTLVYRTHANSSRT